MDFRLRAFVGVSVLSAAFQLSACFGPGADVREQIASGSGASRPRFGSGSGGTIGGGTLVSPTPTPTVSSSPSPSPETEYYVVATGVSYEAPVIAAQSFRDSVSIEAIDIAGFTATYVAADQDLRYFGEIREGSGARLISYTSPERVLSRLPADWLRDGAKVITAGAGAGATDQRGFGCVVVERNTTRVREVFCATDGLNWQRVAIPGLNATDGWIRQLSVGGQHACARLGNGRVYCWGAAFYYQIPPLTSGTVSISSPRLLAYPDGRALPPVGYVATGLEATCVVFNQPENAAVDGTAQCFGRGDGIGIPYRPDGTAPLNNIKMVAIANYRSCALLMNGDVNCWGSGISTTTATNRPVRPIDAPLGGGARLVFSKIDGGSGGGFCGLTQTEGAIYCWDGQAIARFQAGTGAVLNLFTPTPASSSILVPFRISNHPDTVSPRFVNGQMMDLAVGRGAYLGGIYVCGVNRSREVWCASHVKMLGLPTPSNERVEMRRLGL